MGFECVPLLPKKKSILSGLPKQTRRKELIENDYFPTHSEIKTQLGDSLSNVFFSMMTPDQKQNFGLVPELHGLGYSDFWIKAQDKMDNILVLSTPPAREDVRATTHFTIMKIGEKIAQNLESNVQKRITNAITEATILSEVRFQSEYETYIGEALKFQKDFYRSEKEELVKKFNTTFVQSVTKVKEEAEAEMMKIVQREREEINNMLEDKIQCIIEISEAEKNEIIQQHKEDEKRLELKSISNIYEPRVKSSIYLRKVDFEETKESLEFENIIDIAYAVSREKTQSIIDICRIKEQKNLEIMKLQNIINNKDAEIKLIASKQEKMEYEVEIYERILKDVLTEYQKFINFAFKAIPGQAEFLLSFEKLLKKERKKFKNEIRKESVLFIREMLDDFVLQLNFIERDEDNFRVMQDVTKETLEIEDCITNLFQNVIQENVHINGDEKLCRSVAKLVIASMKESSYKKVIDILNKIVGEKSSEEIVNKILRDVISKVITEQSMKKIEKIEASIVVTNLDQVSEAVMKASRRRERALEMKTQIEVENNNLISEKESIKKQSSKLLTRFQEEGITETPSEGPNIDAEKFADRRIKSLINIFKKYPNIADMILGQ